MTNTNLNDPAAFNVLSPRIEEAERVGQARLSVSTKLPTDGLLGASWSIWERFGLRHGKPDPSDPLFIDVELPAGWRKVPTEHPLWTDLVDGHGRQRGAIFFKAVAYDRRANIRPIRRFLVERDFDRSDYGDAIQCVVKDGGNVVFRSSERSRSEKPEACDLFAWVDEVTEVLLGECDAWLVAQGYPNYRDPAAYWE